MKVWNWSRLLIVIALLVLIAGCAGGEAQPTGAPAATEPPAAAQPTAAPTEATQPTAAQPTAAPTEAAQPAAEGEVDVAQALKATSGKKFSGVTVVVVGVSGDQGEFIKKAAKGWEDATGGTVELNLIPFGELQDKVLAALSAGAFIGDVLNVPAYMDGDLMGGGYIEPVPDEVKQRLEWDDIMPLYQEQTNWGGVTYGYPWDGDIHSMYYRKDLIGDPQNQEKFKAKYGYDLHAPATWEEYHDVAEFFTGDWGDGKQHYGSVELFMRKNQGFHGYVSRATCYAKMPDDKAFFFDPDTMDARINNPGFVQALQDAVDILPYSPPDMLNYGFIENAQAFVGGLVALDIQWADIGTMALDPSMSTIKGKVGFSMSPGCTKTWDSRAGNWVDFPDVNYAPYAAFGGWQNLVPKNAKNKEAAIDLAAYLASPPIMKLASLTGGSGVNPARYSTIKDIDAWVKAGFPGAEDAKAYLDMIQKVQEYPNTVFQLRLPGYVQYQDALELAVSKALSRQASPQEALDEAAREWDGITDRLGRDNQKKLYRQSIGLTD